jgi:hypothetical protein
LGEVSFFFERALLVCAPRSITISGSAFSLTFLPWPTRYSELNCAMARSSSSGRLDLITQFRAAVFELANLLRQLPKASRLLGPPALARHGEGRLTAALGKAAAKRGGNTGN